jgi:hypothetical protein
MPPAIFVRIEFNEIRAIKLDEYPELAMMRPGDKINIENFNNHPTSQF